MLSFYNMPSDDTLQQVQHTPHVWSELMLIHLGWYRRFVVSRHHARH